MNGWNDEQIEGERERCARNSGKHLGNKSMKPSLWEQLIIWKMTWMNTVYSLYSLAGRMVHQESRNRCQWWWKLITDKSSVLSNVEVLVCHTIPLQIGEGVALVLSGMAVRLLLAKGRPSIMMIMECCDFFFALIHTLLLPIGFLPYSSHTI